MARFATWFVALTFVACQYGVQAVPLSKRAGIGSFVQCNAARLKIVANLASTTSAVQKLGNAAGGDAALGNAVTTAQAGLKDAQTGIATIAKALISGQAPPAAARDQVGNGLNTAQTALSGVAAPNQATAQRLTDAQKKLKQTISAGQQVVDTCGGGGAAGTSLTSVATASMTATEITTSVAATGTGGTASVTATANNAAATNCPPVSVITSLVTVTVQQTASVSASGASVTAVAGSGTVSSSVAQVTASPAVVSGKANPQATKTAAASATKAAAPNPGANGNANGKAAAGDREFQTPGIVRRRQVVAK